MKAMKSFFLVVPCVLSFLFSFPQIYSGQILDLETGKPIPYANIGIIGKNIGTASDSAGIFSIELNSKFDDNILGISCIGYSNKTYLIRELKDKIKNSNQVSIGLSPKTYQLSEVIIKPVKTRNYLLGNFCDSNSAYGNAFYSKQLGTEIGVLIELPKKGKQTYLKNFRFYVGEFTFEKFPVRLNIYTVKNDKPFENILKEPIYIQIQSAGEYIIDLRSYNIILDTDFFVSLEYYKIPDNTVGKLIFCATPRKNKKKGYFRFTSQGNWEPEPADNLGFSVQVESEK